MVKKFTENKIFYMFFSLVLAMIMLVLDILQIQLKYIFTPFVLVIYLLMIPKKLLNPKNFVFFYYVIFYGMAPLFALRYSSMYSEFGQFVNKAYFMSFLVYDIAMLTLHLCLWNYEHTEKEESEREKEDIIPFSNVGKGILSIAFLITLMIYIKKTGGWQNWMEDANAAFFSRKGSGLWYLAFTKIAMIFVFLANANKISSKKDFIKRLLYVVFVLLISSFVGSRSTIFVMLLMLFSYQVMELDLFNVKSYAIAGAGLAIFAIGMVARMKDQIGGQIANFLKLTLNYFDTFENLLISLRDFSPSFGQTVFLPLNWILMKLGDYYIVEPYHDMSIWLTNIYYPESWMNGGTRQWPIETDAYLSFFFYGGLPLIALYFCVMAYLYIRAQRNSVWRFIYINEAMMIISHLRGGLFIFWYFWLIPLYILLLWRYNEIKIDFRFLKRR